MESAGYALCFCGKRPAATANVCAVSGEDCQLPLAHEALYKGKGLTPDGSLIR